MGSDRQQDVEYLPFTEQTSLPFSAAVRVDNMLYLSGQMGTDGATKRLVPGGIEAETRQTLANMRAILERHGSSLDRVVKCTVMMADMSEWSAMNIVYVEHFKLHLPARSAFGASALALGGRVEIECIATIGPAE
ncbi:RidA family protein [soil metagenome]